MILVGEKTTLTPEVGETVLIADVLGVVEALPWVVVFFCAVAAAAAKAAIYLIWRP